MLIIDRNIYGETLGKESKSKMPGHPALYAFFRGESVTVRFFYHLFYYSIINRLIFLRQRLYPYVPTVNPHRFYQNDRKLQSADKSDGANQAFQ